MTLLALFLCASTLDGAQDQQRDDGDEPISLEGLDYVVAEEDFPKIVELLDLTDAQAAAARESYQIYLVQVAEVARSIHDKFEATSAKVNPMTREALRDRENADWQAIADLMIPEKRHRRRMLLRADRHLDDFLLALSDVLDASQTQRPVLSELPRHIRRWNYERYLAARQRTGWGLLDDPNAFDQAIGIAVEKGILEFLSNDEVPSVSESTRDTYRRRFHEIVDTYDRSQDGRRLRAIAELREPVPDDWSPIRRMTPERERFRGEQFGRRYDAMQRAALDIAALASEYHDSPDAGEGWLREFRAALAPQLFKKWWADDMLDWLESVDGVTPVQRRVAEELHQQFQTEKRILEVETFEAAVAAKRRHASIIRGQSELKVAFYDRVAALNALHNRTLSRLRELLDEHQRGSFDQKVVFINAYYRLGDIDIPITTVPRSSTSDQN